MKLTEPQTVELQHRDWDSQHFGCPVARVLPAQLSEEHLTEILDQAVADHYCLVYWSTVLEQAVSAALLSKYGGSLVDQKTTYAKSLSNVIIPTTTTSRIRVGTYPLAIANSALIELSIAAGEQCRFAVDPLIPPDKFADMYRIWIERSTSGELADAVLVAYQTSPEAPLGMITLSQHGDVGQINLIAVAAAARGQGIGRLLLQAADHWMLAQGCTTAEVITQRHNQAACGLYEKHGYQIRSVEPFYHFWLPSLAGTTTTICQQAAA